MNWKDSYVYPDRYEVSDQGTVRSKEYIKHSRGRSGPISFLTKQRVLQPGLNSDGYLQLVLMRDKEEKSISVHRLVALTFLGYGEKGLQVNHKDGNKPNNHLSNLEWVTCQENVIHSYEIGLASNLGSKHPRSVLTEEIVIECRRLKILGTSVRELSSIFKIKERTIYKALSRGNWKHC